MIVPKKVKNGYQLNLFCFRMCFTRLVTLVLCGTSWEMNFVKDSLITECMVRLRQSVKPKPIESLSIYVSHQSLNSANTKFFRTDMKMICIVYE